MTIQELINKEIEAIKNIPISIEDINKAITKIILSSKVVTSGVGKAGLVAKTLASTLCSTGIPAVFLNPLEAQHGDLGVFASNDLLILVSNSGETRELIELVKLLGDLLSYRISIISIIGKPNSALSLNSDITLLTGYPEEICPLGLTPTTSTTVMGVIADILVVKIMERIGFTKNDYHLRHHSGYLGKISKSNVH